jgi:CelD/BcsL family acetyltransferase involved in cellulose biosynthesis
MRTTVLGTWSDVAAIESAWSELVERTPSCTIYQEYPWHAAWWNAFGADHELMVVVCFEGRRLVGVAPMMISAPSALPREGQLKLRFIGCLNHASDYLNFIVDPATPEALPAILREIQDRLGSVDSIYLSHFPSHLETFRATVDFFRERGSQLIVQEDQEAPYRRMGDTSADRRAANKSSLRRRYNYFRKAGELQFRSCETASEILGYMERFFHQHISRREITDAPSQFHHESERLFYRALVQNLSGPGWLRFDVVLFNGEPIAFHFGFEYRNKFYWYKPTFDIRYADKSPGQVLIKFLLEDTIDRGLDEFDFTVGSEAFKYRFSTDVRQTMRVTIVRSPVDYWLSRSRLWLSSARDGVSSAVHLPVMSRAGG